MTATTRAGVNTFAIAMSSEISTTTPSGDIIYITATEIKPKWTNSTTITNTSARQSFSTRDAKKKWSISIPNAMITLKISGTYANTLAELNGIVKYIEDWTDSGHAPVYLFIANASLSGSPTYFNFRDNTNTDRGYLKGFPREFSPSLFGQVNYVTANLTFEECWL